jgi:hypothetical protein
LPDDWLEELLESGVTKEEVMANPEAIIGTLFFELGNDVCGFVEWDVCLS